MNQNMIEFTIDGIQALEGRFVVGGRCVHGPIRVGDVFTLMFEVYVPKKEDVWGPARRLLERSIRLVVEGVESYGSSFEEVSVGVSAQLTLAGEGGEELRVGRVLGVGAGH